MTDNSIFELEISIYEKAGYTVFKKGVGGHFTRRQAFTEFKRLYQAFNECKRLFPDAKVKFITGSDAEKRVIDADEIKCDWAVVYIV